MLSSFDCSRFVHCFSSSSSSLVLSHGGSPSIVRINMQEAVAKQLRPLASMVQVCGATFVQSLYSLLQRKVPVTMSTFKYCAILIPENLQNVATYCATPKCTVAGITKFIKTVRIQQLWYWHFYHPSQHRIHPSRSMRVPLAHCVQHFCSRHAYAVQIHSHAQLDLSMCALHSFFRFSETDLEMTRARQYCRPVTAATITPHKSWEWTPSEPFPSYAAVQAAQLWTSDKEMLVSLREMLAKPVMIPQVSKAEGGVAQVSVPNDYCEGKLLLYDGSAGVAVPADISALPMNLSIFEVPRYWSSGLPQFLVGTLMRGIPLVLYGHRSDMYALKNIITSTHGGDAPLMSLDLTCYGKATKGTPYLVDEMCLTVIHTGSISQQVCNGCNTYESQYHRNPLQYCVVVKKHVPSRRVHCTTHA